MNTHDPLTSALPYVSCVLDDALAVKDFDPQNIPSPCIFLGWQCGFEPMFLVLHSYLPDTRLDEEEAIEIALDYLTEKEWFSCEAKEPDYVFRYSTR